MKPAPTFPTFDPGVSYKVDGALLNAFAKGIREGFPHPEGEGARYEADGVHFPVSGAGGVAQSLQFSCSDVVADDGTININYGVISGSGVGILIPEVPKIGVTPMTGGTNNIAMGDDGVIALQFDFSPNSRLESQDFTLTPDSGDVIVTSTESYAFSSGGTVTSAVELVTFASVAAATSAAQAAVVNVTNGVITDGVAVLPLARYVAGEKQTPQDLVGPIGISICDGAVLAHGPYYVS